MSTQEIKQAIEALPPKEQAEIEVWIQDRDDAIRRRARFLELKSMLEQSYVELSASQSREWTETTLDEIRAEARARQGVEKAK